MADDEVTLRASMTDEVSAALERIESRLTEVEHKLTEVSGAGKVMGDGIDAGASKAKRAVDGAGRAAETASPKIKKAGDEAGKAGAKAEVGGKGFESFGNKVEKAGKKSGDFGKITQGFRFAAIATGLYALAGAVSAVGAAGAIGVAHAAPLLLNLLNLGPAALTGVLAMAALKLSATQLAKPLDQIKGEFSGLGKEIAGGGLTHGVQNLANDMRPLAKLSGMGLRLFGTDLGNAATQAGNFIKQTSTLNSVSDIFSGLTGVLVPGLRGVLSLLPAVLALIKAIIPSTQGMAQGFANTAAKLSAWIQAESANGNITRWLISAWNALNTAGHSVWNIVVAIFNIFRIADGVTGSLGDSMFDLTQRFRDWTTSAAGQQRITRYFQDSLPAIHQLGQLLISVVSMFGHLASGANIAPLLGLINTQLIPAVGLLLGHLTAVGGLGPTLIQVFANLARIVSGLSFSGFSTLGTTLLTITRWILWLQQNVPGTNTVISILLLTIMGIKALGPIIAGIGSGIKALGGIIKGVGATYAFFTGAADAETLTMAGIIAGVGSALETMGLIGLYALDGLGAAAEACGAMIDAAFVATPIGWIVLAIVAVIAIIVVLYMKCAWFRDAVKAVWDAIRVAAIAVWHALGAAWDATVHALVVAAESVAHFFVVVWQNIVTAAVTVWGSLVTAWKAVWSVLLPIVKVVWDVIKFIIQTAVYIIVGIITLIAIIVKAVWDIIAAGATWLWNTVLQPVFSAIGSFVVMIWNAISAAAQFCWNLISFGATWLWTAILQPFFSTIASVASAVWSGIVTAAQFCWNLISIGASAVWNGFLHPIFSFIGSVGSAIWGGIVSAASAAWGGIKSAWGTVAGFFSGLWSAISGAAKAAWGGISSAISTVGGVVSGVWNTITGAVKGVWNFIARAWNAIPNITVPGWVPGIGGKTFGLPKLPTLYTGGPTPGGPAIVGEHGPEMLVRGGQVTGVLGANGPELANLPRGGYVVPNLATITHGMAKPIPAPVAAAVARSAPPPRAGSDRAVAAALRDLQHALADQRPPIVVPPGSGDTREEVLAALRDHDRERRARDQYSYSAGKG